LIKDRGITLAKKINVFLLDLDPSSSLGLTFRKICESSSHPVMRIQEEAFESVNHACSGRGLFDITSRFEPDLLIIVFSGKQQGELSTLLKNVRQTNASLPIVGIADDCGADDAISLLDLGIDDFIAPPLKTVDVLPRIWRLIQQVRNKGTLTRRLKVRLGLDQIIGHDDSFQKELNKIPVVAMCDSTVLISGETGTGKELFARAIHYLSGRSGQSFIPVNCGAIPENLLESELFGHKKGAYTGASVSYPGLIHEANGGTLFLDEIDCLPLNAQVKLLRFLQDKVYRHLGSTKLHHADIRIITATNLDLEKAVKEGQFRRDLFYRLHIIPIKLPPLRERQQDIPVLAHHFARKYSTELNKDIKDIESQALQKLLGYEWPGNVRELENIIERAVVFSKHNVIYETDIALQESKPFESRESLREAKIRFEKDYIRDLLLAYQGNITRAANAAKKNRRAFFELIRKHEINAQEFRCGNL
jgi:DNA-binding NtrC family response regulator